MEVAGRRISRFTHLAGKGDGVSDSLGAADNTVDNVILTSKRGYLIKANIEAAEYGILGGSGSLSERYQPLLFLKFAIELPTGCGIPKCEFFALLYSSPYRAYAVTLRRVLRPITNTRGDHDQGTPFAPCARILSLELVRDHQTKRLSHPEFCNS